MTYEELEIGQEVMCAGQEAIIKGFRPRKFLCVVEFKDEGISLAHEGTNREFWYTKDGKDIYNTRNPLKLHYYADPQNLKLLKSVPETKWQIGDYCGYQDKEAYKIVYIVGMNYEETIVSICHFSFAQNTRYGQSSYPESGTYRNVASSHIHPLRLGIRKKMQLTGFESHPTPQNKKTTELVVGQYVQSIGANGTGFRSELANDIVYIESIDDLTQIATVCWKNRIKVRQVPLELLVPADLAGKYCTKLKEPNAGKEILFRIDRETGSLEYILNGMGLPQSGKWAPSQILNTDFSFPTSKPREEVEKTLSDFLKENPKKAPEMIRLYKVGEFVAVKTGEGVFVGTVKGYSYDTACAYFTMSVSSLEGQNYTNPCYCTSYDRNEYGEKMESTNHASFKDFKYTYIDNKLLDDLIFSRPNERRRGKQISGRIMSSEWQLVLNPAPILMKLDCDLPVEGTKYSEKSVESARWSDNATAQARANIQADFEKLIQADATHFTPFEGLFSQIEEQRERRTDRTQAEELAQFATAYGMRGLPPIEIGEKTWAEKYLALCRKQPLHVLHSKPQSKEKDFFPETFKLNFKPSKNRIK